MKYEGIVSCTNEMYHAERNHLSSSNLKQLLNDKQGFYEDKILKLDKPPKTSAIFDEGSYAHSLILEPSMIENEYAFFPGWKRDGRELRI